MAGDDDESQSFPQGGTVEGRINALKSTIDSMIQELKRLSPKIDN